MFVGTALQRGCAGHALRHQEGPGQLISVFSFNMGTFSTLFPSLAPPRNAKVGRAGLMKAASQGWVDSHSLNMDSTSSSGPGPPAARSISRVKTASPNAGFSYDAFRLGVSCRSCGARQAPVSDSCLKAVNGQDDARLMHSSCW